MRRRRAPRHAIRARDHDREYRQAVAVENENYKRWLAGEGNRDGYIAAREATRLAWQETQR
jgi:hypothetical protein